MANAIGAQFTVIVCKDSQTVWRRLGNTLEINDYLLKHGAHVNIVNATATGSIIGKQRHPQNRKYMTYSIVVR